MCVRRNQLFRQRFAGVGPHGHFHSQRGARPGSGLKLRRLPCHIRKRGLLKGAKAVESLREAAFLRAAFKLAFQQRFHIGYGQHLLEQADYEQISELTRP